MGIKGRIFESFGRNLSPRQGIFDITLLPVNLSEGRNIGELSGLFLFTAPKKSESSRQSDIFIALFHIENMEIPNNELKVWAGILSEAYYYARGSFTMGVSAAVNKLSNYLAKQKKGQNFPIIFLNIAVLRDRSVLLAHAGPVNSTVISSAQVQNFCNEASLPLQLSSNNLSFYTADIHSEDIILLCPHVPNDWTNSSIMEVTGDSPLNAIRFLLDRSGGNLQAAVIQLKTGKGQISFRTKTTITANIKPEYENKVETPGRKRRRSSDVINSTVSESDFEKPASEKPLFRQRKAADLPESEKQNSQEELSNPSNSISEADQNTSESLTGEQELPGSQKLGFDFGDEPILKKKKFHISDDSKPVRITEKKKVPQTVNKPSSKKSKFYFGRFLLILLCGILIPVVVVSALFFVYSGRSKNKLHREYLSQAVQTAQSALQSDDDSNKENLWNDVINLTEQALNYGNSPAAKDLRREAMINIDRINGGTSTVYNYANQAKLPQGLNITEIFSSGQYTYALDSTSGSVLRFVASGSGLALDNTFSCTPGTYKELGSDVNTIQIGALKDFVLLPSGSAHNFLLAGVDENANILYCSGFSANQAGKLIKPPIDRISISSAAFWDNAMYLVDTQASVVWEYIYSNADGFNFEPSNYYGSYSPYLSDVIDFTMYSRYSYFLKSNGTLMICDYTGYRPDCQTITHLTNEEQTVSVDMASHQFRKIITNASPDNSIYIMDSKLQSILNLSAKGNYIRYIVPNRMIEDISQFSQATGFGITGQNKLLWGYKNDLYIGNMP